MRTWMTAMVAVVFSACGFSLSFRVDGSVSDDSGGDDSGSEDSSVGSDGDANGSDANIDAPLPSNLIAWYPMDELTGSMAIDATGHGHTARCGGADTGGCPAVVSGRIGNGYSFDGNNQRMDVASTQMLTTTTGFTVSFWVRFTSFPNAYSCPVGKYYGTGMANSWQLCNNTDNSGRWFFGADSDESFTLTAAPGPATNVWYHAAITWDPTTEIRRIWIDGTERATQTSVNTIHFDNGPVTLGADLTNGDDQADRFAGILDDVRIYNQALTMTEIQALAAAP